MVAEAYYAGQLLQDTGSVAEWDGEMLIFLIPTYL